MFHLQYSRCQGGSIVTRFEVRTRLDNGRAAIELFGNGMGAAPDVAITGI